jgi:hypothetical protein
VKDTQPQGEEVKDTQPQALIKDTQPQALISDTQLQAKEVDALPLGEALIKDTQPQAKPLIKDTQTKAEEVKGTGLQGEALTEQLMQLLKPQLRAQAQAAGLPLAGTKMQLAQRLTQHAALAGKQAGGVPRVERQGEALHQGVQLKVRARARKPGSCMPHAPPPVSLAALPLPDMLK